MDHDPFNGDAAKLFVLLSEVTILRSGFLYTVKSGDTLSKIARKSDSQISGLAQKIYETNKDVIGPNPNLIQDKSFLSRTSKYFLQSEIINQ